MEDKKQELIKINLIAKTLKWIIINYGWWSHCCWWSHQLFDGRGTNRGWDLSHRIIEVHVLARNSNRFILPNDIHLHSVFQVRMSVSRLDVDGQCFHGLRQLYGYLFSMVLQDLAQYSWCLSNCGWTLLLLWMCLQSVYFISSLILGLHE